MGIEQSAALVETTMDIYWGRKKNGLLSLSNEALRNTYNFADLVDSNRVTVEGGMQSQFDVMLDDGADGDTGVVDPRAPRSFREERNVYRATMGWSCVERICMLYQVDVDLNGGDSKILDLWAVREEAMKTRFANGLETLWADPVGGADTFTLKDPKPAGLKAWITRTGYGVHGEQSVFGIDCVQFPRWLNRYAGPLGNNLNVDFTHNTGAADCLTSANQLLAFLRKAVRYCKFRSPKNLQFAKADDPQATYARNCKVYADEIGYNAMEELQARIGLGRDNLKPEELSYPDPVIKQIPVVWDEGLGVPSTGIPAYASVNTGSTTTSSRGDLTSATWANTGELYLINMNHVAIVLQKDNAPSRSKVTYIVQDDALVEVYRMLLKVIFRSRMRQCCLWGFSPITPS